MLAQNFKTPVDLDMTEAEFDALLKVLGMLEREEIPAHLFKMADIGAPDCGTPGCIMGWARTILPKAFLHNSVFKHPTVPLFFPGGEGPFFFGGKYHSAYDATQAQAAIALRNHLTHGEPRWAEALSV